MQILDSRQAAEKDRLAFIIFLSDGNDDTFQKKDIPTAYPIHAFGFSADHDRKKLEDMANLTSGSYTPINKDLEQITEKLDQLSDKLISILAVDTHINLKSVHPRVYLSKIDALATDETGDTYKSQISS